MIDQVEEQVRVKFNFFLARFSVVVCVVMIASSKGGVNIEDVAANTPQYIFKVKKKKIQSTDVFLRNLLILLPDRNKNNCFVWLKAYALEWKQTKK